MTESATRWLTLQEAAEHIRAKSPALIREAVNKGDLPASRYGKSEIRVKAVDVDLWLESQPWEPRRDAS